MMKINAKAIIGILCCIFALYGLIILIRKIMNKSEKNKEGKWSYYLEPFGFQCKNCKQCKKNGSKTCTDYYIKKAGSASNVNIDDIKACMRNQSMIDSICNCKQDKDVFCF